MSGEGTVYTFELRPGVQFHDGARLDAAAVASSLNRVLPHAEMGGRGPFPLAYRLRTVREVRVLDEMTVQIVLTTPSTTLLHVLASPIGMVVRETNGGLVGTGPFRFDRREGGRDLVFTR